MNISLCVHMYKFFTQSSNFLQIGYLAAIAAEVKQQKATLGKQREEYVKKSTTLQRELEILRQQCDEIGKEGGRENNRIIKENQKLQVSDALELIAYIILI